MTDIYKAAEQTLDALEKASPYDTPATPMLREAATALRAAIAARPEPVGDYRTMWQEVLVMNQQLCAALAAAPPQRKPYLTEEQLWIAYDRVAVDSWAMPQDGWLAGVRFAERHHLGVK